MSKAKSALLLLALCACAAALLSFARAGDGGGRTAKPLGEAEADEELRRAASAALGGREGALVVLDPRTGRVRALVGGRLAFEGATTPGSAVKPFTLLAALDGGGIDAESRASCRGRYDREDFHIACAHPRFRPAFGPAQALANSCNYFFARAAETTDGRAFARTLAAYGFGSPTGGGGEGEASGSLPADAPGVPEMLGESPHLRVTPAQLLTAYAALFNGGHLFVPRAGAAADAEGSTPRERASVAVDSSRRALLLAGMRGAVSYGTAARAGLATLPVYVFGKTGTSTPADDFRPQGWFVGFAAEEKGGVEGSELPPERIGLGVVVLLKRARGSEAAEVARPVFEAYARTLGRGEEAGGEGAAPSTGEGDIKVRVRLPREDATRTLALEDYVFGVLAAEGSVETEPEALKALAVAARTYAVRNLRRHARDHYDLCDSTHCQRFTLVREEWRRPEFFALARRAVVETRGEVLRESSGAVAECYFSASCGGATADASLLWGGGQTPSHLRGVRDESCETESWTDHIKAARLRQALAADPRADVGARLDSVRVLRRDRTGRAEIIEVTGERRRRLRGWDFKIIVGRTLGWDVLKSSRFEVTRAGSDFIFRGRGFGHGLGLCQAGARRLAGRGASYRQILEKYMPGLRISDSAHSNAQRLNPPGPSSETAFGGETPKREEVSYSTVAYSPNGGRQATIRSGHFRLSYPARFARREAEGLLGALESARADAERRLEAANLGARLPGVLDVFVHETAGDFAGVTGRPVWAAAATQGTRIDLQPFDVLRRRGLLVSAARHEVAHVALEAAGRGRAPLWLVEGLAIHFAGEGRLYAGAARGAALSVEEIERGLGRHSTEAEMRALYAAAYREVLKVVRHEGEPAAWRRAAR